LQIKPSRDRACEHRTEDRRASRDNGENKNSMMFEEV